VGKVAWQASLPRRVNGIFCILGVIHICRRSL